MGFFSYNTKKNPRQSINNDDLTILDPQDFQKESFTKRESTNKSSRDRFLQTSKNNALSFLQKANDHTDNSPTESEFSVRSMQSKAFQEITSSGLKGEQERNLILEQQIKILSHQAAKAIDQLNEATKENEMLKKQNMELLADKRKSSSSSGTVSTRRRAHNGHRQTSMSSTNSSHVSSIFSGPHEPSVRMSQGNSLNSLSSYTKHEDADATIAALNRRHEAEMNDTKSSYNSQLHALQNEVESLKRDMYSSNRILEDYKNEIKSLTGKLETLSAGKSNRLQKLLQTKERQQLQIDYYRSQLNETLKQLEETRKKDHELRQRLMEYDIVMNKIQNSRILC